MKCPVRCPCWSQLIFRVVRQSDGKEVPIRFCTDPGFTFHFVNCYEDEGQLVVDFVGYDNLDIFEELYVDKLDEEGISRVDPCFRRYVLPLNLVRSSSAGRIFHDILVFKKSIF